ncbi:MAG: hypothetical protein QNJ42_04635 [Crocosphaera sp.]|nr:hypothetical protein [Crocosphaera sp.]
MKTLKAIIVFIFLGIIAFMFLHNLVDILFLVDILLVICTVLILWIGYSLLFCHRKDNNTTSELSKIIELVIYCAVWWILLFIRSPESIKQLFSNEEELFNLTYEFLLITVVGGCIALLWDQINKERDRKEQKSQNLRQMYSEILSAYNQAKKVRRQLRAVCGTRWEIKLGTALDLNNYDEQIELLSEAQLMFEVYAKIVDDEDDENDADKNKEKAAQSLLWFLSKEKAKELKENIKNMESYLNEILKEYQENRQKFSKETDTYELKQLCNLQEFIGPYDKNNNFNKKFKEPMKAIRNILLTETKEVSLK